MHTNLRTLLNETCDPKQEESYTHVTAYGPSKKWKAVPTKLTDFWLGYCELVETLEAKKDKTATTVCLKEKPANEMPLIAKFKFKFQDTQNEPYDENLILFLVYTYQRAIDQLLDTEDDNKVMICSVLESDPYEEKDAKSGKIHHVYDLRLQFPYCRIEAVYQTKVIRSHILSSLREENVMGKFTVQPVGDWDKIIALDSVTAPVTMYGSNDEVGRPLLQLKHIYGELTEAVLDNNADIPELELTEVFSPDNHQLVMNKVIKSNIFIERAFETWRPLFLSVYYGNKVTLPRATDTDEKFEVRNNKILGRHKTDETDYDIALQMLTMINPDRFRQENYLLDIGKALHSVTNGDENGLQTWIKYTVKYNTPDDQIERKGYERVKPPFNGHWCQHKYFNFDNKHGITFKTLAWYAKIDSKTSYTEWETEWRAPSMEKALSGFDTDVAEALHKFYWLEYICSSVSKRQWFRFYNHRWNEVEHGVDLSRAISSDFVKHFEQMRTKLSNQIQESNDDKFRSDGEAAMKKINSLISKLKTSSRKSSIMREATELFYHPKFNEYKEANTDTIGISNGVLEVVSTNVIHRPGKPEDFITKFSSVAYRKVSETDKHMVELKSWLKKVFVDDETRHHFLKFSSSCLRGRNADKIFPVWTGAGDNSKSMIVKLYECLFGVYCIKFPTSLLTGKRATSSGPTPELARARGARVGFAQEPDSEDTMKGGTIKEFTGGDSFFARLLNENGGDIVLTFKMILMCNKVPVVPHADRAVQNRLKLFPFLSKWIDNPPDNEKEQFRLRTFKKDPFFEHTIPLLAPAFLSLLIDYFPIYMKEGLSDPKEVKETTQQYWEDNDIYYQFTADTVVEALKPDGSRDENAKLSIAQIYAEFKLWFRDFFPGIKVPERTVVKQELITRYGKMKNTGWVGIKLADAGMADIKVDTKKFLGGRRDDLMGNRPVRI